MARRASESVGNNSHSKEKSDLDKMDRTNHPQTPTYRGFQAVVEAIQSPYRQAETASKGDHTMSASMEPLPDHIQAILNRQNALDALRVRSTAEFLQPKHCDRLMQQIRDAGLISDHEIEWENVSKLHTMFPAIETGQQWTRAETLQHRFPHLEGIPDQLTEQASDWLVKAQLAASDAKTPTEVKLVELLTFAQHFRQTNPDLGWVPALLTPQGPL